MKYFEFKENIVHGSAKFPFAYYFVNNYHPRYHMIMHWHNECELIRIISGTFNIKINMSSYIAEAGDIIFLNSGCIHSGIPKDCVYECVVFDVTSLLQKNPLGNAELNDVIQYKKEIKNLYKKDSAETYNVLNHIFDLMKTKEPGYQLRIYGSCYYFLGLVEKYNLYIKEEKLSITNKKTLFQMKKVLSLIQTKYMEEIGLEDIASILKMNEKYFCKFFKQMTNKTPIEYLNWYRIECACEKIKSSSLSLTEIAYDCGFNDTSYFTKVFKKYNGMSPREYKKLYFKS